MEHIHEDKIITDGAHQGDGTGQAPKGKGACVFRKEPAAKHSRPCKCPGAEVRIPVRPSIRPSAVQAHDRRLPGHISGHGIR